RLIAAHAPELAVGSAAPPGSTLKPLVLSALLERGLLRDDDRFPCPGDLRLEGRSFACSHPPLGVPLTVGTAIAYSCNCFVAHYAARFRAGELTAEMEQWGLGSRTNWFGEREGAGRVGRGRRAGAACSARHGVLPPGVASRSGGAGWDDGRGGLRHRAARASDGTESGREDRHRAGAGRGVSGVGRGGQGGGGGERG